MNLLLPGSNPESSNLVWVPFCAFQYYRAKVDELEQDKRMLEDRLKGEEECYGEDFAAWERERQGYQVQIATLKESERTLNNQVWKQQLAISEMRKENRLKTAELERLRALGIARPS